MEGTEQEGAGPRVAAGATWLDDTRPGWHNQIDMAALNMDDVELCVAGWVFGNFWNLPAHGNDTRVRSGWAKQFGFMASLYATDYDLRSAWVAEIESRRAVTS